MSAEEATGRAASAPPDPDAFEDGKGYGWGDYGVPVFIFLFCGVVIWLSLTFDEALPIIVGHSMQPRVFPIFLMVVIGVLNVALIVQMMGRPASRRDWEPYQTWASGALWPIFYVITENVDMMLALIMVMFTLCIVWGERRLWVAALVAFGTTAAIFFSFDQILEVRFPRGLLTNWYYG